MGRARRKWTPEEDALLRTVVSAALAESRPLLWRELAKDIPGRSNKDCRRRWWNSLADGTAKGLWSEEEDGKLIQAVKELGTNWRVVAQHVGSRTPDQCSSHWTQVLDPDINHCDWTSMEDDQLLHEVLTYSTNWTTISAFHVPRRTTLALKNRYSTLRLKHENKRKRRRSIGDTNSDRRPPSERSKPESTASPSSCGTSPYQDDDSQREGSEDYAGYAPSISEAMEDETEGMTSGTSTLGSVTSADMDLGADWSGFLGSSNDFCNPSMADGSSFSHLWRKDMDLANYDEDQFLAIDPSMSVATDADPFNVIRDPLALYAEPIEADFGYEPNEFISRLPLPPSSTQGPIKTQPTVGNYSAPPESSTEAPSTLAPYQLSLDMTCSKAQLESLMGVLAGSGASFTVKSKTEKV
ncbi:hypothetical protein NLG97_g619 [Lecanicillium saksenae]|uniref:Uncharacterized protein n=1 Tax=Lecanicillium saksenae TaxID=468837 RepID=A0ACC1R7J0_9HYPO|nr:hypothetical protein NLG97_g619 [Lecanicillium saksenae]